MSTFYYEAWDKTGTWLGSAKGNSYCTALDADGFAMVGSLYVQHTNVTTGATLYNPSTLFNPPGGHTYPDTSAAWYIWDSTFGNWINGTQPVPAGYVDFTGMYGFNTTHNYWLYPAWVELPKWTLKFNANYSGGTNPASQTAYIDSAITTPAALPRSGYTQTQWNFAADGSSNGVTPGGTITTSTAGTWTMYAIWKKDEATQWTISYDANGGTGAPSAQTKYRDQTLTLSSTRPTRTGYNFKGWSTTKGSATAQYQPGGAYTANAGATLYAVWEIVTYNITYYANGGSGITAAQTKEYGKNITLRTNGYSYTGYDFVGWCTNSAGTGNVYAAGATYSTNASLNLWAKWQKKTYTITYNANGGSGAPSAQTKTHDVTLQLSTGVPTRSGYRFLKWNTASNGSGTNYSPGAAYTSNANVTLYAIWEQLTSYSVTYNANGGTGAPSATTGYAGNTVTLSSTKPTRANTSNSYTVTYNKVEADATISKSSENCTVTKKYTFLKWNTAANGSGRDYTPGQSITLTGNMTLYAIWSTTNTGGVTLPTGSLDQYVLEGFTESQNSATLVSDPYYPTKNITLYASWKGNGAGGYLKITSATDFNLSAGDVVRLVGCADPNNDDVYTVKSYSFSNGVAKIEFEENFKVSIDQDAAKDNLMLYGAGTYVPDMDYICSLNNRLWGCSNAARSIYASALGDPTDFNKFEGDTLDSYAVAVGTAEKFTGCMALNSTVLFFKQHCIHKMMGGYPAEYALYTYALEGASETNGLSGQNCDGSALYISEHGINIYSGSDTGRLSKELGEGDMYDSVSMYDGEKYFLHYKDRQGNAHTYIYDIRYGVWTQADYGNVNAFAHMQDKDYVLCDLDGQMKVYCINTGIELTGDWFMEFKPFYETIAGSYGSQRPVFEKKRYTGLTFRVELPKGSWIKAIVTPDEGFPIVELRKGGRENNVQDFAIRTPRCDKIKLRLEGHGNMTILAMEREYVIGSRR